MPSHNINIDIQEVAYCIERIRKEMALIEYIIQQALLERGDNGDIMD